MKKVIILGGNGFIGKRLASYLLKQDVEVYSFDLTIPSDKENGINYIEGDFFDDDTLIKVVEDKDIVFHCVCTINPGNSWEKYMQAYNLDFIQTVKLCRVVSETNKKMVFLSSGGTVYGKKDVQPIEENSTTYPINHYGALKICIENVIHSFNERINDKIIIARISNPYGPGQDYTKGVGFIDAAIKNALSGKDIVVFGDGSVIRDYIYIDDVVKLLYFLSSYNGEYDTFNVSTGIGTSQNEILNMLKTHFPDMKIKYEKARDVDLKKTVLSNKRLMDCCDYKMIDIKDGIFKYVEYLKDFKN